MTTTPPPGSGPSPIVIEIVPIKVPIATNSPVTEMMSLVILDMGSGGSSQPGVAASGHRRAALLGEMCEASLPACFDASSRLRISTELRSDKFPAGDVTATIRGESTNLPVHPGRYHSWPAGGRVDVELFRRGFLSQR